MIIKNNNLADEYLLRLYIESYKKFKYWISIYYIVFAIIILSIPRNITDWNLFLNYNKIIKINNCLDEIHKLIPKNNDWYKNKEYRLNDIIQKFLAQNIHHGRFKYPFVYRADQEGLHFKKKEKFLDSLSIKYYGEIIPEVPYYLNQDSIITMKFLNKFDNIYQKESRDKSKEERDNTASRLRPLLTSSINKELDSLFIKAFNDKIIYKIHYNIDNNILFSDELNTYSFYELGHKYRSQRNKIKDLMNKSVGNIPYVNMGITLLIVYILMSIFFLVSPYFILLLYCYYCTCEIQLRGKNKTQYYVSSLKYIFDKLYINNNVIDIFFYIFKLLLVFVFPMIVSVFVIYSLKSFYPLLSLFIYIILMGIVIWTFITKHNNTRLINYLIKVRYKDYNL